MNFEHDVYIVLDVGEPLASAVEEIRRKFDPRLAKLPVEIGVAGSSGLGTVSHSQDPKRVFRIIEELASSIEAFELGFKSMTNFYGTKWFYLEPANPEPFIEIHQLLSGSDIEFNKSSFPYTPHCSLADMKDKSLDEESNLKKESVPEGTYLMDRISLYCLKPNWDCHLLFQFNLQPRS